MTDTRDEGPRLRVAADVSAAHRPTRVTRRGKTMAEMSASDPLWVAEVDAYRAGNGSDALTARSWRRVAMRQMGDPRVDKREVLSMGPGLVDLPVAGLPLTPFLEFLRSRADNGWGEYERYLESIGAPRPGDGPRFHAVVAVIAVGLVIQFLALACGLVTL